jgi:Arc/MetJ-type ribon-helix-helix transcriptional regulator
MKKLTVSLPSNLHSLLARLALQHNTSVSELVRSARRAHYTFTTTEVRLSAVNELAELSLPSGSPEEMERESVAAPEPLP